MTFTYVYLLFQIYFPIDSLFHYLSHLNIISSFIIYSLFNNYISSNIFYSTLDYYNRKKKIEEWTIAHQTWWAIVHQPKIILGIENPLEWLFLVSLSIIENILLLHRPLEMLLGKLKTRRNFSAIKALFQGLSYSPFLIVHST